MPVPPQRRSPLNLPSLPGAGRPPQRLRVLAAAVAAMGVNASAALEVRETNLGAGVPPGAPIVLRLDRAPLPADGALAIFIGTTDATTLFRARGAELVFDGRELRLEPGELPLVLWQVQGDLWREIYRATLEVRAPQEAPAAELRRAITPTLELTIKAQTDESARGSATASPRPTYNDLAGRGGIAIDAQAGGASVRGGTNFAGASYRQEALQFGARGVQARKVDLSDYRLQAGYGPATLTVGHVSWGSHPLLLNSYASRGVIGAARFGNRADVSLSALNGTSIVGFDNFFGLNDAQHRIYGATFGLEAAPAQPGLLRAEATLTDASLRALNNFNRGEIPDAEQSRGGGLRLSSRAFDSRLRLDLAWGRATYRPAEDPQLAQGLTLTPLAVTTRWARQADIAFDLLRGLALSENWKLTLTPSVRYDEAQPLYKMLGASLASDSRFLRAGFALHLGAVQMTWFHSARRDNLDDLPNLLTTRTESNDFGLNVPLPQLLGAPGAAASAWPQVSLQGQRNRQFAANAPDFAASGIEPSHRPDQHNRTVAANFSWQLGRHAASYGVNHARQDNRQPGRENADFFNLAHQASVNLALADSLTVNLGANRGRQYSAERAIANINEGATAALQWRFREAWSLAANAGLTRGEDSRGLSSSRGRTAQTQLSRAFRLPSPFGSPTAGQWFVRHALTATQSRDNATGAQSDGRQWSIQLGASLTVF